MRAESSPRLGTHGYGTGRSRNSCSCCKKVLGLRQSVFSIALQRGRRASVSERGTSLPRDGAEGVPAFVVLCSARPQVIARVFLDPHLRLFDYCPKRLLNRWVGLLVSLNLSHGGRWVGMCAPI